MLTVDNLSHLQPSLSGPRDGSELRGGLPGRHEEKSQHHQVGLILPLHSQGREKCFINRRKMIRILGGNPLNQNFNPENMKTLDNFLEANLDAHLIHDELKIDAGLEEVPEKAMESLLNDFLNNSC